jgi:hypothetical protein
MAFLLNGKVLKPDHPFVDVHGNQYPAGWLRHHTLEEKQAIGIVEVPDLQPKPE